MRHRGFRKISVGLAALSILSVGLTVAVAVNPNLIGQWFTLFEEFQGTNLVYKVEARVIGVTATGAKTADLDIQVRVTNNHAFGINLTFALFTVVDLRELRTTLKVFLPVSTFPANSVTSIFTTGKVIKVLGLGNKYLVDGTITWKEVYPSGEVGPFTKFIHEVHSVM